MTTTLKGIFPEKKPPCKRNFIKENMQQLKRMQGIVVTDQLINEQPRISQDKFRTIPKLNKLRTNSTTLPSLRLQKETKSSKSVGSQKRETANKKSVGAQKAGSDVKLTDRGVQTERPQDVGKLYEKGTIIYPRTHDRKRGKRKEDHGDTISRENIGEVTEKMQGMDLEEKNYVKDNIQALKLLSPIKKDDEQDKSQVPKNYQRGVLPKYLKIKKDEKIVECDPECPPGHVLLPEEERKETLRVLRQSYADRIQELNSMPVRNDTLKMRKRKMEIEDELKKIDEGIKVFQRFKVFVKINA